MKKDFKCLSCGKLNEMKRNTSNKFCNNKCQQNYKYESYIVDWKNGEISGTKGSGKTLQPSSYIRRYIFYKYSDSCANCGFNTKHPVDGSSILEIDHIDGDASNNKENNLILLCPNCHALTPTFRARNKNCTRK